MTEDFSPIEPDVSELKFYAKGSGQAVLAVDVSGGTDREELVSYTRLSAHWALRLRCPRRGDRSHGEARLANGEIVEAGP